MRSGEGSDPMRRNASRCLDASCGPGAVAQACSWSERRCSRSCKPRRSGALVGCATSGPAQARVRARASGSLRTNTVISSLDCRSAAIPAQRYHLQERLLPKLKRGAMAKNDNSNVFRPTGLSSSEDRDRAVHDIIKKERLATDAKNERLKALRLTQGGASPKGRS
jgi:uncharacterized protein YbaA (DUF1428 family)